MRRSWPTRSSRKCLKHQRPALVVAGRRRLRSRRSRVRIATRGPVASRLTHRAPSRAVRSGYGLRTTIRVRFAALGSISRAPTVSFSALEHEAVPVACQRVVGSSPWLAISIGGAVGWRSAPPSGGLFALPLRLPLRLRTGVNSARTPPEKPPRDAWFPYWPLVVTIFGCRGRWFKSTRPDFS